MDLIKFFPILFVLCSITNQLQAYPSPEGFEKLEKSQNVKTKDLVDMMDMKDKDEQQNEETNNLTSLSRKISSAFEKTFNDIKDGFVNLFGRK